MKTKYIILVILLVCLIFTCKDDSTHDGEDNPYTFITSWSIALDDEDDWSEGYGIAVDSNFYIYVTDWKKHNVKKFNSEGVFQIKWGANGGDGSSGILNGEFNYPKGITVDSDNYVYVVDYDNARVQKFTSYGTFITKWGKNGGNGEVGEGDGEFYWPNDIGIDKDNGNRVYTTDDINDHIQIFDLDGNFISKWYINGGESYVGDLSHKKGIAVNNSYVYISDGTDHTVSIFSLSGTLISKLNGEFEFDYPTGIDTDHSGNFYVCDIEDGLIRKFGPYGSFISELSLWDLTSTPNPIDIAIDSSGYIYVLTIGYNGSDVMKFIEN